MNKQDTPEYALHQLKCLIDAHKHQYKEGVLNILGHLEDAVSDGQWELDREDEEDCVDENAEHRIGTFEAGVVTG